jgi:hypothetical protein
VLQVLLVIQVLQAQLGHVVSRVRLARMDLEVHKVSKEILVLGVILALQGLEVIKVEQVLLVQMLLEDSKV